MLYTNCILRKRTIIEGRRISVMSRHTLSDGKTLDTRITPDLYDEHFQILSPPLSLLRDYYKRNLPWEEFKKRYLEYIQMDDISQEVEHLADMALKQNITLLCIEESPERCHRKILAEECQKYKPSLQIIHL